MKKIITVEILLAAAFAACGTVRQAAPDATTGDGAGTDGDAAECTNTGTVLSCVCPGGHSCFATCLAGEVCHVEAEPAAHLTVTCSASDACHVDCVAAASCNVDCNDGPDCHVTGPATSCTVTDCVQGPCQVTCGGADPASILGTTATCP